MEIIKTSLHEVYVFLLETDNRQQIKGRLPDCSIAPRDTKWGRVIGYDLCKVTGGDPFGDRGYIRS